MLRNRLIYRRPAEQLESAIEIVVRIDGKERFGVKSGQASSCTPFLEFCFRRCTGWVSRPFQEQREKTPPVLADKISAQSTKFPLQFTEAKGSPVPLSFSAFFFGSLNESKGTAGPVKAK